MAVTIVETLFQTFDKSIVGTISSGASNLMNSVAPIFSAGTCIFFGFKALGWYRNGNDIPIIEVLEIFIKCTLICFLSFNVGNYLTYIVPIVNGLSDDIASLLSNTSKGTTSNTIDLLLTNYLDMVFEFIKTMKISILKIDVSVLFVQLFALIIMLISGIPFIMVTCGTLFCVKIGMNLMLIIGPLFIGFLFFPATKDLFWGWAKLIISFIVINVLFSLVITLEINFINDQFINNPDPTWAAVFSMLICFASFIYLAKAIPSFAGAIAGSHGASSIGLPGGGAASGMMRGGGKLAGKAGKYATGKAYNTVQAAYNRVRGSFKPG
ncbi:type IV secretion system protein [Salmonella enterica subsp. enterica serovar Benue]|uniref:type IV secretion system protein n=1 Tax=Salmonella enterica TaxID=28901 RepID=UPI000FB8A709|nr:type IV secretion system protein [Salmonella enterica]EDR3562100.1 type IV secretion system protein [Salmonella enterica subsp. enterica serovar Benue]MIW33715.1 hypothetical protein [Salmonella enterica subsp. enterica serovar Derby]MBH0601260.1 type IV secretion system protein [Salmonella enterica]MBH0654956.1 type IV secretion system protein [Salmonella enterica]MBH0667745.1 type IV secretion system protein [Salmonella enterica]